MLLQEKLNLTDYAGDQYVVTGFARQKTIHKNLGIVILYEELTTNRDVHYVATLEDFKMMFRVDDKFEEVSKAAIELL